ncbi:MAG: hypothetical protein IKL52_02305 [Candidatus Gastranaerophilales bacterium]|nr:hypothetical protein [Candidatus Gastranaerophilales bacterium]
MKVKHLLLILIILLIPLCHFAKKIHTEQVLNDKAKSLVQIIKNKDSEKINEVASTLNAQEIESVMNWMDMHSGDFVPLYYIAMADYIFEIDKEKAVFWYFIGRLRSTQDVFMCADESARAQIGIYPMFAQKTLQYASGDLNKLRCVLARAMLWDSIHFKRQSPKWSCYHGIDAMLVEPELVSKKEQIKRKVLLKKDFWKSIFKKRD